MWVKLNNVKDIQKFVSICTKSSASVFVHHGPYCVDGASIMGMYSLDLEQPVNVEICGEDEELINYLKEFKVEE